jgi:hypothetical protein
MESPHRSRAALREERGSTAPREGRRNERAEDRSPHRTSRVDDMAEALFAAFSRPDLKRIGRGGDGRDRVAGSREGEETRKVPRTVEKPETVHAARRTRSRPSGSTRGRLRDRGPTPVDAAPPGKPAGRRGIRGTPAGRRSEKTTLRHVGRNAEVSQRGVNRRLPYRVGNAMRRSSRLGESSLKTEDCEQQTSVEWTGVAAGPRPT